MPASTGTHCRRCTSQRGVMRESWAVVFVALASCRAAASLRARFAPGLVAISIVLSQVPGGTYLSLHTPFPRCCRFARRCEIERADPDAAGTGAHRSVRKQLVEAVPFKPPHGRRDPHWPRSRRWSSRRRSSSSVALPRVDDREPRAFLYTRGEGLATMAPTTDQRGESVGGGRASSIGRSRAALRSSPSTGRWAQAVARWPRANVVATGTEPSRRSWLGAPARARPSSANAQNHCPCGD